MTPDEETRDPVAPSRVREEAFDGVAVPLRVLPFGALGQLQRQLRLVVVGVGGGGGVGVGGVGGAGGDGQQGVGGLRGQERQLGRDARRARGPAEEAAQLREAQPVHGWPRGYAPAGGSARGSSGAQVCSKSTGDGREADTRRAPPRTDRRHIPSDSREAVIDTIASYICKHVVSIIHYYISLLLAFGTFR